MPISVPRGEKKPSVDTETFDKIQSIKTMIGKEAVNTATRRYHTILKTLNDINFQVDMNNKDFYMSIFYQALLEQQIANPKAF